MMLGTISTDQMMLQCPPRQMPIDNITTTRWKSNVEIAPNCPRCSSSNTKFCYYNNYSLSQPRYFCKGCRRYWTKGGSLRNVPVGGGCRKTRKAKAAAAARASQQNHDAVPGKDFHGSWSKNNCSSSDNNDNYHQNGTSSGSDIDLAAVFAKFLNDQDHSVNNSDQVNFTCDDHQELSKDSTSDQCQDPLNPIQESDVLQEMPPLVHQEFQEFVTDSDQDMNNAFGGAENHHVLSEEIMAQDCLWSDAANLLPNLAWQPTVQLQEFDIFSSDDDQLIKISTDLIVDNNWSSFDLSGIDVLSRS